MTSDSGSSREPQRLQLTVDAELERVLEEMVSLGIYGRQKTKVAVWIIQTWIWANEEKLGRQGIRLGKANPNSSV